jgi:hypothetical protein
MNIEVDLSNRLEESGPTFLAFSNSITYAIKIPTRVKKVGLAWLKAQRIADKQIKPLLWAGCVCILLKDHLKRLTRDTGWIIVDNEFDGYQAIIKRDLLAYIRAHFGKFSGHRLIIRSIGKKSPAHERALQAKRGKKPPDRVVTDLELLKVLKQ